mgnify:FL=1
MNYTNEQIRRQDRLLEKEKAISLLKNGEYGVLSMQDEENGAYGVPINYVWNKKNSIYIHCAPEGRKLHCIKRCNTVSFCIIGKTHIISNQFTTEYESIILKCRAYIGLNEEERINALHLLIEKYSPNDKVIGNQYAQKSFSQNRNYPTRYRRGKRKMQTYTYAISIKSSLNYSSNILNYYSPDKRELKGDN